MFVQVNNNLSSSNLDFTPEFKLVAACSWVPKSRYALQQDVVIVSLLNSELDWKEVTSLVLRHQIVGQFCAVMGKNNWCGVPQEVKEVLKNYRVQQVARALGQVNELKRIGQLFSEAGINLLPLKGVALSQEIYGDPCIRSSWDLDILVRPDEIEKAGQVLIQAGYCHEPGFHELSKRQKQYILDTHHHHGYMHISKGVHVELHWSSYLWNKEQIFALWNASKSSIWLDSGLRQLSIEEGILFLADHAARHDWTCLKWLSDIAMMIEIMSDELWSSLVNKANIFGLHRVIGQTFALLEWFYGIEPPQHIRAILSSDTIVKDLSDHAARQLLASAEELSSQLKKLSGLRLAIRIKQLKPSTPLLGNLKKVLISHDDFFEIHLPDYLFWLYVPLRPYFWFRRHYMKR